MEKLSKSEVEDLDLLLHRDRRGESLNREEREKMERLFTKVSPELQKKLLANLPTYNASD